MSRLQPRIPIALALGVCQGVCPDCIEAVKTNGYYFVEW